jgi:hypothetical protein
MIVNMFGSLNFGIFYKMHIYRVIYCNINCLSPSHIIMHKKMDIFGPLSVNIFYTSNIQDTHVSVIISEVLHLE